MLRYVHYSETPLLKVAKPKKLNDLFKPCGLWFSVDGNGDGWVEWCRTENFRLSSLAFATELSLELKKFRVITNAHDLNEFDKEFGVKIFEACWGIKWTTVANLYSGIIISPYIWECRLRGRVSEWYYGWDCASGCVWDTDAVKIASPSVAHDTGV
jgi:hypothetical protein